mmetsp:Transcript_130910/g.245012  ORF Transcript_130910/g.245012 Transcript_130910/m.245012 type:complete len:165 (-) Transcript_130910:97-591(-)
MQFKTRSLFLVAVSSLAFLLEPAAAAAATSGGRRAWKAVAARSLAAAGVPDPMCKTGVIALAEQGKEQACCAGYCGECSDYPTCKSVRGQDSTNACCKSEVVKMKCGAGAPANVCLKSCSESVPPCIMDKLVFDTSPPARNAADNCTTAKETWKAKADNAIKAR